MDLKLTKSEVELIVNAAIEKHEAKMHRAGEQQRDLFPVDRKGKRVPSEVPVTLEERNFELARTIYPGRKRGFRVEFINFCKHSQTWREDLEDTGLADCVQTLIDRKAYKPGFWPHFQTFINQSRWEEALQPPEAKK